MERVPKAYDEQPPSYNQATQNLAPSTYYTSPPVLPIVTQATVIQHSVGPCPMLQTCTHCLSPILTRVEYEPSVKTHLLAMILCLLGACYCSCLPYFVRSCQDVNHYCPNCNALIGTYVY